MDAFSTRLRESQQKIIKKFELLFEEKFIEDCWQSSLGQGITAICQGRRLEKAGVNISFVHADQLPKAATKSRPELVGEPFTASGLSLVFHPSSPHIPTVHLNIRKISCVRKNIHWFGGGYDLTPYIPSRDDSRYWHAETKKFLDRYDLDLYPAWSKRCQEYFYLPHREEPRGIGGIFFDDFLLDNDLESTEEMLFLLVEQFIALYSHIVCHQKEKPFTQKERSFQLYRRGRYVEFNLLYDRGTHFGLQSGGRIESIFMSLPKNVSWIYAGGDDFSIEDNRLREHWEEIQNLI